MNSDPLVFAHVMLNALDLKARGGEVAVVVEADATKQVALLRNETKPHADVWHKLKSSGIQVCVCRACAHRNTVEPACVEQKLKLCDEMDGHPSVAGYLEQGYTALVF
jgi:intracellular sulfur oxidation DsrE/DsrF family protein